VSLIACSAGPPAGSPARGGFWRAPAVAWARDAPLRAFLILWGEGGLLPEPRRLGRIKRATRPLAARAVDRKPLALPVWILRAIGGGRHAPHKRYQGGGERHGARAPGQHPCPPSIPYRSLHSHPRPPLPPP